MKPGLVTSGTLTFSGQLSKHISFLYRGKAIFDCHSPTEAAYIPVTDTDSAQIDDYREQFMAMLSSVWELAASNIQRAQRRAI